MPENTDVASLTKTEALAVLVEDLGQVPLERIRLHRLPDMAEEKDVVELTEDDSLDGGDVFPVFSLKLRDLFEELDRRA